jgi:hypothetical protein
MSASAVLTRVVLKTAAECGVPVGEVLRAAQLDPARLEENDGPELVKTRTACNH